MFAITADQVDSRHGYDLVERAIGTLTDLGGAGLLLPVERTAGDELQTLTDDPATVVDLVLALARSGSWSVGVGVGDVDAPLPDSTRAATGSALFHARDAVERAKRTPDRFALEVEPGRRRTAADVEPLLAQTIRERGHRDDDDWAVADLLGEGMTQGEIAARLGVSQQAVSKRVRRGALRSDAAVRAALARLLADTDVAHQEAE